MPLLEVEDLRTYYYTLAGEVKAVDGVSFEVEKGEVLGLAGESGCGKSTIAWSIMRLVPPPGRIVSGRVVIDGKDIVRMEEAALRRSVRWRKVSMVFQGAMNALNPVYTVGQQIAEPMVYHLGMDKTEAERRVHELLEMVGLDRSVAKRYPHELSGGMRQRAVIAMALALNPALLIADEPTTALDVVVQAQILNLLKELRSKLGMSIILITHDLSVIAELADKVAIMYAGKLVEIGTSEQIFENPYHPYTKALLNAIPRLRGRVEKLAWIPGAPPDLRTPPPGCRFHPRCSYAKDVCKREDPPTTSLEKAHKVSCWLYGRA